MRFSGIPTNPAFIPDAGGPLDSTIQYLGVKGGQCVFANLRVAQFVFQPNITNGGKIDAAAFFKLYFEYETRYVPKMDIYFAVGVFESFFATHLASDQMRDYTCSIMENQCAPYIETPADCREQLAALPVVEGPQLYFDGNSQGCRYLHAYLALLTPELHCPHISLTPVEDPNDKIKCQAESQQNLSVSELFSQADLAIFADYTTKFGIDPGLGVIECVDETSGCARP